MAAYPRFVPACTNCGAELPSGARFCPRCTAPVEPSATATEDEPPQEPSWRRRWERIVFAALVILFAGLVALLVLVFGFGFLVEDSR